MPFLHTEIIYGPVQSRRLGLSLGINILPTFRKVCSFECLYCECGWTDSSKQPEYPSPELVSEALEQTLLDLKKSDFFPDHITFSGNGEPTLHPDFSEILRQTYFIRNRITPTAQIAVLTNGTTLNQPAIVESLSIADRRIIKLDAGSETLFQLLNQPRSSQTLKDTVAALHHCAWPFEIQTLFLRGEYQGQSFDNTKPDELRLWLQSLRLLKPRSVMIYSLERTPPVRTLQSIPREELERIAEQVRKLDIDCQVF